MKWLWYPYLPRGKLTIVQGDSGVGNTTFVLAVIAALTRGEALPESEKMLEPLNVICQTAEDGAGGHYQATAGCRRHGLRLSSGHRREQAAGASGSPDWGTAHRAGSHPGI